MGAWGNVHEIPQLAVVIHASARINDAVLAYHRICLYHGSGHYNASLPQFS